MFPQRCGGGGGGLVSASCCRLYEDVTLMVTTDWPVALPAIIILLSHLISSNDCNDLYWTWRGLIQSAMYIYHNETNYNNLLGFSFK